MDFYIQVREQYIGLQIKPINTSIQLSEIKKEYNIQSDTHRQFTDEFGGKVFYVYSTKRDKAKEICNKEVIQEIQNEIDHLLSKGNP